MNKSLIEKETSNLQQSDQIAQLNEQLEQKGDLEELLALKNNEIEMLKEYKRRKEAESEELRLSGGYEEASKPLRMRSKEAIARSADQLSCEDNEQKSQSSAIRDQIL